MRAKRTKEKVEFTYLWELHFRMPGTYTQSMAKKSATAPL